VISRENLDSFVELSPGIAVGEVEGLCWGRGWWKWLDRGIVESIEGLEAVGGA
jgi:hypothetical protein